MRADRAQGESDDLASMPLADLLLALGASFLVALFAVQPALMRGPSPTERLDAGAVSIDGRRPLVLFAERDGAHVRGDAERIVPLAALASDPALLAALRRAEDANVPILLAIRPDGQEAAFLLEAALSAASVQGFHQIRLTDECRAADPSACTDLRGDGGTAP